MSIALRPLRFGVQVSLPRSQSGWLNIARRAELVGFSSFLVADHFVPVYAPWSALGAAAAVTTRLRIGPLVLNNDFRNPVAVAHEAATLDRISCGRLELGVGAGWNKREYEESGIRFEAPAVRIRRLEESLAILNGLLAGEHVQFKGDFYSVDHSLGFMPLQGRRPPLTLGANGDRMLSLACRAADTVSLLGSTINQDGTQDFTTYARDTLARKVKLLEKSAAPIELSPFVSHFAVGRSVEEAVEKVKRPPSLSLEDILASPFALLGTVDDMCVKIADFYRSYGLSYWVVKGEFLNEMAPVIHELGKPGSQ